MVNSDLDRDSEQASLGKIVICVPPPEIRDEPHHWACRNSIPAL